MSPASVLQELNFNLPKFAWSLYDLSDQFNTVMLPLSLLEAPQIATMFVNVATPAKYYRLKWENLDYMGRLQHCFRPIIFVNLEVQF